MSGGIGPQWSFNGAGSGGKKPLFTVCYALALHVVASRHDLPLQRLLIVDTPMKNIGEGVNKALFESFYCYLYVLAAGPLADTQFVIIDKEFVPPLDLGLDVRTRYMTPDEVANPPLISYYRGA